MSSGAIVKDIILPYHLKEDRYRLVNLGSFYTSNEYVRLVWDFIKPYISEDTVVFDPACGYGGFLKERTIAKKIGNDIDKKAIEKAKIYTDDVTYFNYNALISFERKTYHIGENEKLIIIGNPPYNDITSQAKKSIKKLNFRVDERLKARDIGISFLRMFFYLRADYVCVLHPLSYLIKKANFRLLKCFKDNYRLIKGIIISSKVFCLTSKSSEFPIIIALYERNSNGMDYEYIENFKFQTIEGKSFKLSDFDYIGNYIDKYPKKNSIFSNENILFYTLRDINALKRNKTFIDKPTSNAVKVKIDQLDYYVYVDVFKDFISFIPYYLVNLDVIINKALFMKYKRYFISYALKKRNFLRKYYHYKTHKNDIGQIKQYFRKLLKEHFNGNISNW